MLAKMTSKNQITLPKAITAQLPAAEYFHVVAEEGRIVLTPLQPSRAADVRAKLEELGITETDVTDAVAWARRG